ncbi:hypothetical protein AK830_g6559 [Neonectria ditissima]|uniref:Uncharacterized protein n=1 Tax=Neonectria ditissima TaxID=78410 RepID=A0A0N8H6V2_9HYPO|nr:hypothetical protein AK830_g6559 [Neonectria ditissima]
MASPARMSFLSRTPTIGLPFAGNYCDSAILTKDIIASTADAITFPSPPPHVDKPSVADLAPRPTPTASSTATATTTTTTPLVRSQSQGTPRQRSPRGVCTCLPRAQTDTSDSKEHAPTPASLAGFNGVLQDGRVRNPVPSKLQGRVDGRNGNFGVMHMDFPRPQMTERDLAAKRSSEGTAAAAKLANKDGYRAVKRTQLAWPPRSSKESTTAPWRILLPPPPIHPYSSPPALARPLTAPPTAPPTIASAAASPTPSAPPSTVPPTALSTAPPAAPPGSHSANSPVVPPAISQPGAPTDPSTHTPTAPPSTDPSFTPASPSTTALRVNGSTAALTAATTARPLTGLTPQETKVEQARLLTLLRSLHPVLVVDQICKALAYFGGIPGSPAPANGAFPDSDLTNGPGSLFVGWVAEIFPELDAQGEPIKKQTPIPALTPVPVSVSVPVPVPVTVPAPAIVPVVGSTSTPVSPSRVSIPVKRSRGRPKGSKSSRARKDKGLKKPRAVPSGTTSVDVVDANQYTPANLPPVASQPNDNDAETPQFQSQASVIAQAALREQHNSSLPVSTPGSKKRGRPKGSKNKPRPKPGTIIGAEDAEASAQSQNHVSSSPLAHKSSTNRPAEKVQPSIEGNTGTAQDAIAPSTTQEDISSQGPLTDEQVAPSDTTNYMTQAARLHQLGSHDSSSTPNASSRKRQRNPHMQTTTQGTVETNNVSGPPDSSQTQSAKRRRVSKETSQNPVLGNAEPQSSGAEIPTPSNLSIGGESLSTSSGFDSQSQMNSLRSNLKQMAQTQHQYQHQQQQASPNMASSHAQGPSAQGRQKPQPPGGQGRPQPPMTPQSFYQRQKQQQRQPTSQYEQGGNPGQFQQNLMSPPSSLGGQPQQQQQHAGLPNPISPFTGYSNSNYLDINYPDTSTNTATAAAFGGHTQLEAALAEPNIRESLYHAIGRP